MFNQMKEKLEVWLGRADHVHFDGRAQKILRHLAELIREEKECVAEIYSDDFYAANRKKFGISWARRQTNRRVQLWQKIGEELLPTGFLPETAVLGELHYGTKKCIAPYPKKVNWEGGDELFDLREVSADEIRKYVSLSTNDTINSMEQNDENQRQIWKDGHLLAAGNFERRSCPYRFDRYQRSLQQRLHCQRLFAQSRRHCLRYEFAKCVSRHGQNAAWND